MRPRPRPERVRPRTRQRPKNFFEAEATMYEAEARQVREQLSVYEASQAYYFIWPRWYSKYLFKNCAGALAVPLCHIFDFSFKNGVLPVCWKTAYVLPIYKKGCTVIHVIIDQFH